LEFVVKGLPNQEHYSSIFEHASPSHID